MQKAIKVKTKASLLTYSIFKKMDRYVAFRKQLVEDNKVSIQTALKKDSKTKKPKPYNQKTKPATIQPLAAKISNKVQKEKKKDYPNCV